MDEGHIELSASVRDKEYLPAADARVTAHVIGPEGLSTSVDMVPVGDDPGVFHASWAAEKPGSYLAEVTAQKGGENLGSDTLPFARTDGVAENFPSDTESRTVRKAGERDRGRYWKPSELGELPSEISYSDAGVSVRDIKELWNMPVVFLWLLLLVAAQWLLRRKWGVV